MKKHEIEGFLSHLATALIFWAMGFESDREKNARYQGGPSP
jgi:hypothetical protein